ncbi:MAG: hypothetical protein IKK24_07320, partial [Clostridia bacterium]|nr:hypothetical protein [Clostridia bacterium]
MKKTSAEYGVAFLNFLIFAILFLLHFTGAFRISTLRANAFALIPFLTAFSMFNREWVSALTGLAVGIFTDSSSANFNMFHTVTFMFIGLAVSFTVHYLFNNNFRSAVALSLLSSLFYFVLRWILFHAIGGAVADSIYYLMQYALPSVI